MMTSPIGPPDASRTPRFAGISTFARLPRLEDVPAAEVAVVGIPFDSGVSYRPGARFGPEHVRASSRLLRPFNPVQNFSPWNEVQVADAGDIAVNPFRIDEAVAQIDTAARALGDRVDRILTIGGDHTIAYPLLRAIRDKRGPVAVVHFDAHLDTWDTYFDAPVTHGTPFRRAAEEGCLAPGSSVHVGTRGPLYDQGDLVDDARLGFEIVTSEDIEERGIPVALDRIRARVGAVPLYVSVDIDVLDPAHAPGTGTPESGGLTSRELLRLIRGLADLDIVGADIVEVSPAYDHAQLTGIAASHVGYELITAMARSIERGRTA